VQLLSGECFGTLRQQAQVGRLLDPTDNAGARPVAVISDGYWLRRFNRDPQAVGRDLMVNGTALTVVGVTGPAFYGAALEARPTEMWVPAVLQPVLRYSGNVSNANGDTHKPWTTQRELSWLSVLVRVPDGQLPAVANIANAVTQQNHAQLTGYADDAEYRARLAATSITWQPGARGFSGMRNRVTTPLVLLLLMVGLVLAVACGNLASLLLARASHRNREMAVRLSIGAGRFRLVRQLLTESLLLALCGGLGGLLAAQWGSGALVRYSDAGGNGLSFDVQPDWRVVLFTLGISVVTGLLFGLLPALRATRVSLAEAMKSQARSVVGGSGSSVSRLLIAGQMALSLLLLIAAGLFARSLQQLTATDVGFNRAQVLAVRLSPEASGYSLTDRNALHQRLLDRLGALPGVVSVSMSGNGPFSGSRTTSGFEVQGYTHGRDERLRTQEEIVTPGYFGTVGLKIVRGRPFSEADTATGRRVSIINETVARRYFGGQDPIGRRWSYDTSFGDDSFEIVGVAADARYNDLKTDSLNMVYRPARQADWYLESLEVRTAGTPAALASAVQAAIREAEPRLVLGTVETLDSRVSRTMGPERMLTVLVSVFGLVALGLACLGLYGTVSYAVTRRTAELGVRMALGADRRAVRWLIMREALVLVFLGLAAGLPLALLAARGMRGLLYGVSSIDVPAYLAAVAILLAIATLAAFLPARRASRLDPVIALRAE
jgi:predicted permease